MKILKSGWVTAGVLVLAVFGAVSIYNRRRRKKLQAAGRALASDIEQG